MGYELKKIHLHLAKEGDSKMIVVNKSTIQRLSGRMESADERDKTYSVNYYPTQKSAVRGLAEVLTSEFDDFKNRLVETDRKEVEKNNQRGNRYFSDKESDLPGRDVGQANGLYIELHGNRSDRYDLARTMRDVSGVKLKIGPKERSIKI